MEMLLSYENKSVMRIIRTSFFYYIKLGIIIVTFIFLWTVFEKRNSAKYAA